MDEEYFEHMLADIEKQDDVLYLMMDSNFRICYSKYSTGYSGKDINENCIPNYQIKWNTLVQNKVFINSLPKHINGLESLDNLIQDFNNVVTESGMSKIKK